MVLLKNKIKVKNIFTFSHTVTIGACLVSNWARVFTYLRNYSESSKIKLLISSSKI